MSNPRRGRAMIELDRKLAKALYESGRMANLSLVQLLTMLAERRRARGEQPPGS